jgi:hypothetical protein
MVSSGSFGDGLSLVGWNEEDVKRGTQPDPLRILHTAFIAARYVAGKGDS